MSWIPVDEAYVRDAMPTELASHYETWIWKNPDKSGRLAEIISSVVADFRTGLRSNATVVMDPAGNTLPGRGVRHALTIIFYNLSLEMGFEVDRATQTALINAEIYARQLYTIDAVIDRDALGQTPSYQGKAFRPVRTLRLV